MTESLERSTDVITFNLAIYSKVREVQWKYPEEFKNLVMQMSVSRNVINRHVQNI